MNPPRPNYSAQPGPDGKWRLCEDGQPLATCESEIIALWLADLARQQREVILLGGQPQRLILSIPQRPN